MRSRGSKEERMRAYTISLQFAPFLVSAVLLVASLADGVTLQTHSDGQQTLNAGGSASTTVPALPVARAENQSAACRLDLSDELFGGVGDACARGGALDRGRCCPVLAAWLFAAHARSALELRPAAADGLDGADGPMVPDDNQKCVESLQSALKRRDIRLPRPNATCDTVLCFCGIRLHQIGSLRCPAAFNVTGARSATPTAAVRQLERDCRNASYSGCNRCLRSLDKLKEQSGGGSGGDRATKMFGRDCQLMGLTWLLARNKTAYIPAVSAVLRAMLYGAHPLQADGYRCSPDQDNMPLAVDSLQFQHLSDSSSAAAASHAASVFALVLSSFAFLPAPLALFWAAGYMNGVSFFVLLPAVFTLHY